MLHYHANVTNKKTLSPRDLNWVQHLVSRIGLLWWSDEGNQLHQKSMIMTRSLQLHCVRVTAFSQTDLFLD